MQDQVGQLKAKGIKAIAITSGMSRREIDIQLDNAIYGNTKFLYVSPERLKSRLFRSRLDKMNINFIAVDEAHCISEWGYDFRPAYLQISEIKELKPNTPTIALTATATPEVLKDIQEKLSFSNPQVFQDSFERKNLTYNTLASNNKLNRLMEFLDRNDSSGIIYCKSRKSVKQLSKHLISNGLSADFYHGGLGFETRKTKQESWIKNECKIMVCTNAFGMGIDKPDVRFVLHYDIPETIEAYFQEAGRAGRDGNPARTLLFYEPSDIDTLKERVASKYPPLDTIKQIYNALGNYFQLAIGAGKEESFPFDVVDFCDRYNFELISCYNSLKFLALGGNIELSQNMNIPSKLRITTDQNGIYQFQIKEEKTNKLIQFILRTQMGIFDELCPINEAKIAKHTGILKKEAIRILQQLDQLEAAQYIPQLTGSYITYTCERLTESNIHIPNNIYHARKKTAVDKVNSMIDLLLSKDCTNIFLLHYFGQNNAKPCGKCNKCLANLGLVKNIDIQNNISNYLNINFNKGVEILISQLISHFSYYKKEDILAELRRLSDQRTINIDMNKNTISKG
jgi:ATP-dependent DNA helicase RecQ